MCNPGQTCGNNACLNSGTTITTTSTTIKPTITISTTATISQPTTKSTAVTTTSKTTSAVPTTTPASSTKTTTSKPPPSSSTTSGVPTPTLVSQIDSFGSVGCFSDTVDTRDLVADTKVDQSSTGMTVEKCIKFAQQSSWRYAGVEFGGYVCPTYYWYSQVQRGC